MSYLLTYDISYKSMQIIKTLGQYRGMTAKQLTKMIHAPVEHYALSDEKSTYNFLGKLKKQGLVLSYKLQANVAPGSLYYLSAKGYELFKEIASVELEHYGDGWIESFEEFGDRVFGDFSYELYKPPLSQVAHHLLLIEFFIQVKLIDGGSIVDHRLNLYAAQTYYFEQEKHRFRPDAEIWFHENNYRYTIEIDRGTEDFSKLQEKFKVYKYYFDYLKAQGKEEEIPSGIIFVAESKRRLHGIKRRWATILKAFWSKLWDYSHSVNLIFTTTDQVENTLKCEMNRREIDFHQRVKGVFPKTLYQEAICIYNNDDLSIYTIVKTKDTTAYHVVFTPLVNEYESLIYTRWLTFYSQYEKAAKKSEDLNGLVYKGRARFIFYNNMKPFLFESFDHFELGKEITDILNKLKINIEFKQI